MTPESVSSPWEDKQFVQHRSTPIYASSPPVQRLEVSALVVKQLHINTPRILIPTEKLLHLQKITLADPAFNNPSLVSALLASDIYSEILLGKICRGLSGQPVARETKLGWIISGPANGPRHLTSHPHPAVACPTFQKLSLSESLQRFWELDEPARPISVSTEDDECDRVFVEGHHCLDDALIHMRSETH